MVPSPSDGWDGLQQVQEFIKKLVLKVDGWMAAVSDTLFIGAVLH